MARTLVGASAHNIALASAVATAVPITFAGWLKPATLAAGCLISLSDNTVAVSSCGLFALECWSDGIVYATTQQGAGAASAAGTSTTFSTGSWIHACAVFAAANSRAAYLNGGGKGTETTSRTPSGINRTTIGHYKGTTNAEQINGDVAECAIWSAALTDDEVLALARGISPWRIRPASLVSYVPAWGLHSPELDLKTPANSWTVTGGALANHAPVQPFSRRLWGASVPPPAAAGRVLNVNPLDGLGNYFRGGAA